MDPIGFGLENYDGHGQYKTTDTGRTDCAIDGAGSIPGVGDFHGPALEMAACKDLPENERPGCIFPQPIDQRPKPWTAVRIFIERASPPSCVAADAGATDSGNDSGKCPEYPPNTVGFCGGENDCPAGAPCACAGQFCCSEGFCYTRDIAGCTQVTCPPGAGRTDLGKCCCNCWDDKSKVNVYDPCRAGFLLRCDPAP